MVSETQLQLRDLSLARFLRGHVAPVQAVAFSPDPRYLASGSSDGVVMIWAQNPKSRPWTLHKHTDAVNSLDFHPTGKTLASASRDRTVRLWHVSAQAKCNILRGHAGGVQCARFSPDGSRLMTASDDKTIKARSLRTWPHFLVLSPKQGGLRITQNRLPDEQDVAELIVLSSILTEPRTAKQVWTFPGLAFLYTLCGHTNWVRCVAWHPWASQAVSCSDDHTVRMWDLDTQKCTAVLRDHEDRVNVVAFDPKGTSFASAGADGCIKVWRTAEVDADSGSQAPALHFAAHDGAVTELAYHKSGRWLLSSALDGTLRLWDLETASLHYTLHGHEGAVLACAFTPSGKGFASGGTDRRLLQWEAVFSPSAPRPRSPAAAAPQQEAAEDEQEEQAPRQQQGEPGILSLTSLPSNEDHASLAAAVEAATREHARRRHGSELGRENRPAAANQPAAEGAAAAGSKPTRSSSSPNIRRSQGSGKQDGLNGPWNHSIRVNAGRYDPSAMSAREPTVSAATLLKQVVGRLDEVDQRLRQLDSKVQASDQTIQDIASKVAGMAAHASA